MEKVTKLMKACRFYMAVRPYIVAVIVIVVVCGWLGSFTSDSVRSYHLVHAQYQPGKGPTGSTGATGATGAAGAAGSQSFGFAFGDSTGSALTSGSVGYFIVPKACTISAWNITVDAGTATFDIWRLTAGTAIPTVANSITAAAQPAISSGTALHSTTLTAWTTSVAANSIIGIQLKTVATAAYAALTVECN